MIFTNCKRAILILISCVAVLLVGCGKTQSLKSETPDVSKEKETATVQGTSVDALSGKEKEQIKLISKKAEKWIGKDTEESPYQYYAVTDLDQNGNLEIIASTGAIGSGAFTYTEYYQVSSDGKALKKCNATGMDDIVNGIDRVYYDRNNDIYYYITADYTKVDAEHRGYVIGALFLKKGKIKSDAIAQEYVEFDGKKDQTQYYSYKNGMEKKISKKEYDPDKLVEKYFDGCQKKDVTIHWVQFQKKWDKLSDQEIESELSKSYEKFKNSMTTDKKVQNLHFPIDKRCKNHVSMIY